MGGLKAACIDTGGLGSAGEARRLACQAGIIPVVLGGPSEVLDVARRRRFHPHPIRTALAIRDGGCTAEGCDWPPGMCHAHHTTPWHQGGPTPTSTTAACCVPTTTREPTTPPTRRPTSPAARSPSPGEHRSGAPPQPDEVERRRREQVPQQRPPVRR